MKSNLLACASLLAVLVNVVVACNVHAADRFYLEPNVSRDKLKLESSDFLLYGAGVKLGVYMIGHYGLELQYSQGFKEDKLNNLQVELASRSSAFLRYGSLPARPIRGYFLLGHSRINLDYNGPNASAKTELNDFAWAVGAEEKLRRWRPALFNVEYAQHYNHHGDIYYIMSMGLRYEF